MSFYGSSDTIFALATGMMKSAVAIIRISGPRTLEVVRAISKRDKFKPRQTSLTNISNPITGEVIDQGLVLWFPGPNSFTGEDSAELQVHGSKVVIKLLLTALSQIEGMRMAEPGEFAKRAFVNGRMDLAEAEGLADLIDAETSMQHKQAIRQMKGEMSTLCEEWRSQLISALALVEAFIDFPDEDLPDYIVSELQETVGQLYNSISNKFNDNMVGERLREGLFIAIIGAPNVGKSSLLNALAKREVAIVSPIAGTTRDLIEVNLDIGGYPVTLCDTAGLRNSNDVIENEGIKRARERASTADCKIAMFDASILPELDKHTLELIDQNTIIIYNKVDIATIKDFPALNTASTEPLLISTREQQGIEQVIASLTQLVDSIFSSIEAPVITRQRHRDNISTCLHHLEMFNLDKDIELAAEDLRLAARALGKITGKIDVETILDSIFSSFCIGK
jgi:tRNA modification GTPase